MTGPDRDDGARDPGIVADPDDADQGDATLAVPRRGREVDGEEPAEDRTLAAPRRRSGAHGAAVEPGLEGDDDPGATADTGAGGSQPESPAEARRGASPLDAEHRIGPAPGGAPAAAESGAGAAGLPVVYGARPAAFADEPRRPDRILERIGPAPAESTTPPAAARPPMPSLERRARRRNIVTLGAFAATLVVSVAGLWIVGSIALG